MKSFLREIYHSFTGLKTPSEWDPYTKLLIKSSNSDWVLDTIRTEMLEVCSTIGVPVIDKRYAHKLTNQSIFYTSKYEALDVVKTTKNRIAFPYYHGDPQLDNKFKHLIDNIKDNHHKIQKIQVSQSHIENIILNTGIPRDKVNRIPISIDIDKFQLRNDDKKRSLRKKLGISESTLLVGSFQKDGDGWGSGEIPKLIKGPDIFLKVVKALKQKHSELAVLLTGPARGFIKNGLRDLNIDYYHFKLDDYSQISNFYSVLDLYIIASREEGGPRAVLESMASGVPLVTTKVGQAMDLVSHKINGWMVEVEDLDGLISCCEEVIENRYDSKSLIYNARQTAEKNSYNEQIPLWKEFMNDLVDYNE